MERTSGPGDGFLIVPAHAEAFRAGLWQQRACRWCGLPLEVEGTYTATYLLCVYCDDADLRPNPHDLDPEDFTDINPDDDGPGWFE